MSIAPAPPASAPAIRWHDPHRWVWLAGLLVPSLVGAGPLLVSLSGSPAALWLPLLLIYGLLPLLDLWLGADARQPPESAMQSLQADRYYRWITWAIVPLLWGWFIFGAWYASRTELPLHALLALVLCMGVVGGFCINVGHELGHRRSTWERLLAQAVLAPTCYGHFSIEHNRGHHRDVATLTDPASARLGESFWRFVRREWPGAWRRAWRLEHARLAALGHGTWSTRNLILRTGALTLGLWSGLALWLGPAVLGVILPAAVWANLQLSSANYIEHYGLRRAPDPSRNGAPERVQPCHSWNSNARLSNAILFHLQRHADHHAHPGRRYQCLRHWPEAPQLPTGYFGMFLLAYVPPLWFRVMDPRVVVASGGDPARIQFEPRREAELRARWQAHWASTSLRHRSLAQPPPGP